jgi:phage replication-related protein YjqB (UPF0714/DUF867 family)
MIHTKTPIAEIRRWGFFISFLCTFFACFSAQAQYKDHFKNFADLSSHLKEGVDYRISVQVRTEAPVSVFAIHGGVIEPGTSALARELAGKDYSLYLFEGLKSENAEATHLTAAHFDEPKALQLAQISNLCISVHGFLDDSGKPQICVGGGNEKMKAKFLATPLTGVALVDCKKFPGKVKSNIINRCKQQGVQLELSPDVRDSVRVARWIRTVLGKP